MRVQKEPVAIVQAEHPLSGQHDKSAQHLNWNISIDSNSYTVRKADLTRGLLDTGTIQLLAIATNQDNFSTPVVDTHRHKLAVLTICGLLAKLVLPMIKAPLVNICLRTELANGLSAIQELLIDGLEVI